MPPEQTDIGASSVGIRKGEVSSMRQYLQDSDMMKDPAKREKVFSRFDQTTLASFLFPLVCSILFYVAQGIDMSSLFADVIKVCDLLSSHQFLPPSTQTPKIILRKNLSTNI